MNVPNKDELQKMFNMPSYKALEQVSRDEFLLWFNGNVKPIPEVDTENGRTFVQQTPRAFNLWYDEVYQKLYRERRKNEKEKTLIDIGTNQLSTLGVVEPNRTLTPDLESQFSLSSHPHSIPDRERLDGYIRDEEVPSAEDLLNSYENPLTYENFLDMVFFDRSDPDFNSMICNLVSKYTENIGRRIAEGEEVSDLDILSLGGIMSALERHLERSYEQLFEQHSKNDDKLINKIAFLQHYKY